MAQAAPRATLPAAENLSRTGTDARTRGVPVLLLFSQGNCEWCEAARRDYLVPLHNDPASRKRVIVREVAIDSDRMLIDFGGRRTTHREFASRQKVRVAPTVIVFDPRGERAADPLVGYGIPDFYGAYVERAVDRGLARSARAAP